MASSGKFDLSTVSPDRPLYNNSAQRGSYTSASSLDRSSSFRDTMENPILSSLPSMSRSTTSSVTQVDVTNFLQCLRFDPKSMASDHKFNRHGDFRRLASAVLGSPDESPSSKGKFPNPSTDDLKRFKAGLRESTIKARERVKVFSETLSVVNKCFPSIPSRKRTRGPDGLPGDRASGLLINRAPIGTPKIGAQSHSLTNAFDFDQQKVEERGKNVIPNKRTRTSMEVRPNTPARSSGNVDREKEPLRLPTSNEERPSLPIVADGWEKAKMKKKRTGIKVDASSPSPSSGSTKPIDGYREPKQVMHPRHVQDGINITRLNDSHGFRPGAGNGVVGSGKADGLMRPSIPRPEIENTSVLRTTSSEKERAKRSNTREEFLTGSPTTSTTKLHTPARGPRSGSNIIPKSSAPGQRNDWELTHGTVTKNSGQFGSGNRKRTPATRSPSPPVTQWADRRPQKMSRTARRTNLVPILPNDEVAGLDTSDVTGGSPSGPGFAKRFLPSNSNSNSPQQQFKSKGDHFASSTLSESEESGAAEIRSRDNNNSNNNNHHNNNNNQNNNSNNINNNNKGKKCGGGDEEGKGEIQNMHKMAGMVLPTRKNKMVNGEDIGDGVRRQGRTGRGFGSTRAHAVEKIRNVGTAKQLRTAKVGFDKSESRLGRPPTRKLSDRKAYTRQKQTAVNSTADFLVGSDDGHEELLAAANAVINPNRALSSPYWRQMEPLFGFVSDVDMLYLKQQGSIQAAVIDIEPMSEHMASPGESQIPLCQRLLAALISEEGNSDDDGHNNNYNVYGFEKTDVESNHRSHRINNNHIMSIPDSDFDHSYNGLAMTPPGSEYQYGNMSLNDRLLIEIQSIGLYPELVPDTPNGNDGISAEISRLEGKHHEQVSRKKSLLDNLMEITSGVRERQEKEFEQHCLEKLTAMAYQKYMSCWGPHGPGGKGVGSKMAKQAALGFVRRTLDRCHEFETTRKSCFSDPLYKEMLRSGSGSGSSHLNDAQTDNNDFDKSYSGTQVVSPSLNNNNNHDIYSDTFHISDHQNIGKEDVWSSRVKKRELYLDDVVSGIPTGFGATILNSAKGKRSERDREGKGTRNGPPKLGRPASVKGERKTKTKLKQKTTQLSASVNGPIGRTNMPSVVKIEQSSVMKENEYCEEEPLDFSHLPLPEMDVLGVGVGMGDELGEQGQDIGSWLNIDDDILQDDDFLGLEIPMDDLSDLNMMV